MTHKHGRIDANQPAIVDALRKHGASVWITSDLGFGGPDIVVGWRGRNIMMQIKDGDKHLSAQALTDDEGRFHESWRGSNILVINSIEAAIKALK